MHRISFFLFAASLAGFVAATAAQALDQGPPVTYCDRQRQRCIQNCRGEPLCATHCTYSCGSRFPLAGTTTRGLAAGTGAPAKPAHRQPVRTKELKAAPLR